MVLYVNLTVLTLHKKELYLFSIFMFFCVCFNQLKTSLLSNSAFKATVLR